MGKIGEFCRQHRNAARTLKNTPEPEPDMPYAGYFAVSGAIILSSLTFRFSMPRKRLFEAGKGRSRAVQWHASRNCRLNDVFQGRVATVIILLPS